jgi:hypothetical protein
MRPEDRYKKIHSLVREISKSPRKHRRALKAARLALRLADEILEQLETGSDPGLTPTLQWSMPPEGEGEPDEWRNGICSCYERTSDLVDEVTTLFLDLVGFSPELLNETRRVRRLKRRIRPDGD